MDEGGGLNQNSNRYNVVERSKYEVEINHPDGIVETRIGGSRSWRNNNPANLRSGKFTNKHGAIGDAGGFAVFPNEIVGDMASISLLKSRTYSNLSINDAIARRSPPNENDTTNLQNTINLITGVNGDKIIKELNDDELSKLAEAIKRTEGWIPGNVIKY